MSVQDFSQIIGTAAPAYAQVRQIRDQRRADKTQAELAREKLASDMAMGRQKLEYDAQQDEKKRQFDQGKMIWDSTLGSSTWQGDEAQRQDAFNMLPADFLPPAPPPTPFPWQGAPAPEQGSATAGPALPRLAENFAPGQRFSAFAKVPEAQKKKLEGEQATIDATKAKTRTEEAALPGVVADAAVKSRSTESRLLEQYLNNEVLRGKISQAEADIALAEANAGLVTEKTATEKALREPTVSKAEADARIAGANSDFAPQQAAANVDKDIAAAEASRASSGLQRAITPGTVRNIEASAEQKKAQAKLTGAQAGVVQQDANTRRMQAEANKVANSIRQSQLSFDRYKFASDGRYRKLVNDKLQADIANLKSNNAVPDGLKLEIESLNRELSAVANAAGSGLRPDYTQMQPIMDRLDRTLRTLPAVTKAPEYGMSASTAHMLSKQVALRVPLPTLEADYRAKMAGKMQPAQIEAGIKRIQRFYQEFSALDVSPEGETLEAAPKPK